MYINSIKLKQLGPIEELAIFPRFAENGNPIPIALVGQNGAGKSLTLAVVLDAITEARRASFTEIQEVRSTDYLRLSSKNYVRRSGGYSHAQAIISADAAELKFDEVVSNLSYEEFEKSAPDLASLPTLREGEFKTSGFYKYLALAEPHKQAVRNLPFLYFPYFRYEPAYWMSEKANVDFVKQSNFYGQSKLNPIRANIIEETKRWILNVLLDREVYERRIAPVPLAQGGTINAFLGYHGPNTQLFNIVNEILAAMLRAKDSTIVSARVGIGPKGNREIAVFATKQGKAEEVVAPDLSQLSSGELMTLGLATEVIRAYELVTGRTPNDLKEVTGIVLIDEVDLHLHVSFQKSVLPLILRKFPNVQFLMTTHSPFFLLGMAESGEIDIYSLPIGNHIAAEEFTEFQVSYDIFFQKNEQFRARYESLHERIQIEGRPLIITEGKTDWRHIQLALSAFKAAGEYADLDIEIFEFTSDVNMGDTKLSQMCEYMATLPQRRTMIFIFDRDNPSVTKKMAGEPNEFRGWGNKVFSLCLPIPPHRAGYKNLSIELYYTDEALRTVDPASGKRLWFTNEIEIITNPTTGQNTFRALAAPNETDEYEKKVFDQPADQIIDSSGKKVGLSKAAFTEVIVGNASVSNDFDRTAFKLVFDVIRKICV